jgi:hypothetical protein
MRIQLQTQTDEVAGGRSATSAQPQRATSPFIPRLSSSHAPHPNPPFFAFGTTVAPLESLRCYPLSARSQEHTGLVRKTQRAARYSR